MQIRCGLEEIINHLPLLFICTQTMWIFRGKYDFSETQQVQMCCIDAHYILFSVKMKRIKLTLQQTFFKRKCSEKILMHNLKFYKIYACTYACILPCHIYGRAMTFICYYRKNLKVFAVGNVFGRSVYWCMQFF